MQHPPGWTHLVAVGVGNIGSHLIHHLARMSGITRLTLIDPQKYATENLPSQNIMPRDVGRSKVAVQAQRIHALRPELEVVAIADVAEHVPPGIFRGSIVLGALDSRIARRRLAAAAWHAGARAYIDGGVEATGMLARVDVYVASADAPCYECGWEFPRDYAAQEQQYPCDVLTGEPASPSQAATDAPSSLGALTAALQAIECAKMLAGHHDRVLVSRRIVLDANWHKQYVTALRRNPDCRFDHAQWHIEPLSGVSTLADLLALADADIGLRLPGHAFVRRLSCGCGHSRPLLRLASRLRPAMRSCPACGQTMHAAGFDLLERVRGVDLPKALRDRPLRRLGLLCGDVIAISHRGAERYYELTGPDAHADADTRPGCGADGATGLAAVGRGRSGGQ